MSILTEFKTQKIKKDKKNNFKKMNNFKLHIIINGFNVSIAIK